jgi:catechol 2,3-dioxygenase-like lactoylglutathione lyase family enzyme
VSSGLERRILTSEHMTIQRMDPVGIVVDDLAAATEFFVELGRELQGEGPSKVAGWTASWGSRAYGRGSR